MFKCGILDSHCCNCGVVGVSVSGLYVGVRFAHIFGVAEKETMKNLWFFGWQRVWRQCPSPHYRECLRALLSI